MVVNDDWSTGQMVAVAELLDDLLYVNHSRYQEKLYAHWKATGLLRSRETAPMLTSVYRFELIFSESA